METGKQFRLLLKQSHLEIHLFTGCLGEYPVKEVGNPHYKYWNDTLKGDQLHL